MFLNDAQRSVRLEIATEIKELCEQEAMRLLLVGLLSEELDRAAIELKEKLGDQVLAGVAIDDSFFEEGIKVPGVSGSDEPYDALNSATAVNFNTINVVVDGEN